MRGELPVIKPGDFLIVYDEAQNVEVPGIGEDGRSIWLTIPMPGARRDFLSKSFQFVLYL